MKMPKGFKNKVKVILEVECYDLEEGLAYCRGYFNDPLYRVSFMPGGFTHCCWVECVIQSTDSNERDQGFEGTSLKEFQATYACCMTGILAAWEIQKRAGVHGDMCD